MNAFLRRPLALAVLALVSCAPLLPDWSTASRRKEGYAACRTAAAGDRCRATISDPDAAWDGVCAADPEAHGALLCVSPLPR